jgi:hypothetical protein
MLQGGDTCLGIFDEGFRPWPHVFKDKGRSKKFYEASDRNLIEDLHILLLDPSREDADAYTRIMRDTLFWNGYYREFRVYDERLLAPNGRCDAE